MHPCKVILLNETSGLRRVFPLRRLRSGLSTHLADESAAYGLQPIQRHLVLQPLEVLVGGHERQDEPLSMLPRIAIRGAQTFTPTQIPAAAREAMRSDERTPLRYPSSFSSSSTNGGTYFCVMRQSVSSSTRR